MQIVDKAGRDLVVSRGLLGTTASRHADFSAVYAVAATKLSAVDMVAAAGDLRPMKVNALQVTGSIGQTTDAPCSDNSLYVQVVSTSPVCTSQLESSR